MQKAKHGINKNYSSTNLFAKIKMKKVMYLSYIYN